MTWFKMGAESDCGRRGICHCLVEESPGVSALAIRHEVSFSPRGGCDGCAVVMSVGLNLDAESGRLVGVGDFDVVTEIKWGKCVKAGVGANN